jgi:hypothetical protein
MKRTFASSIAWLAHSKILSLIHATENRSMNALRTAGCRARKISLLPGSRRAESKAPGRNPAPASLVKAEETLLTWAYSVIL